MQSQFLYIIRIIRVLDFDETFFFTDICSSWKL